MESDMQDEWIYTKAFLNLLIFFVLL